MAALARGERDAGCGPASIGSRWRQTFMEKTVTWGAPNGSRSSRRPPERFDIVATVRERVLRTARLAAAFTSAVLACAGNGAMAQGDTRAGAPAPAPERSSGARGAAPD